MIRRPPVCLPLACAGLTLLAIGGCAYSSGPRSHTDLATEAACRSQASEIYNRQNRAQIYSVDQTGLPYSASLLAGNQTNTLAAQYANDKVIDDCIRNTDTGASAEPDAQAAPPAP